MDQFQVVFPAIVGKQSGSATIRHHRRISLRFGLVDKIVSSAVDDGAGPLSIKGARDTCCVRNIDLAVPKGNRLRSQTSNKITTQLPLRADDGHSHHFVQLLSKTR